MEHCSEESKHHPSQCLNKNGPRLDDFIIIPMGHRLHACEIGLRNIKGERGLYLILFLYRENTIECVFSLVRPVLPVCYPTGHGPSYSVAAKRVPFVSYSFFRDLQEREMIRTANEWAT